MAVKEPRRPESLHADQELKSTPTVSIGMPTYKRPQELRRALDGIVGQTYPNLEIIVSDNASPGDEVEAVVREFMLRDGRIQYHRQEKNFGPECNFQFVLDRATGEFFMWASDDDWRAPEFVSELVNQLTAHPEASLAFCNFIAAYETGEQVSGYPDFFPMMKRFAVDSMTLRQVRFFLQADRYGKANAIYGLIRKKCLDGFTFKNFTRKAGSYGTDMLFVFWLLGRGTFALSDKNLYRSTVGNEKTYARSAKPLESRMHKIWITWFEQLDYSWRYLLIAGWRQRFFLLLCWPLKVMQLVGGMLWHPVKQRLCS